MRAFPVLLSTMLASAIAAAEPPAWPQFRGPAESGVAPDSEKPPTQIGPSKNLKWKVAVPAGFSSPVVAGNRLFLTGFEKGKLFTLAYRCTDGAELWRKEAPTKTVEPFMTTDGSPAASTPATDGARLVVYFGSCGLVCYDMAGRELWKRPMEVGEVRLGFGSGSSPVIADGRVILLRDLEREGRLLCLDLTTGSPVWEASREGYMTSWGSPCVWRTPAGAQVVVGGGLRLEGHDLQTGKAIWTVSRLPAYPCTTPVVSEGKLVYASWSYGTSSEVKPTFDDILKQAGEEKLGYLTKAGSEKTYLKGHFDQNDANKDGKITRDEWDAQVRYMTSGKAVALLVSPGGSGELTGSHIGWKVTKGLPYIPSPLVYRGLMYLVNNQGRLSAFEMKTGKEVYSLKQLGLGAVYASPIAANGYVYLCGLNHKIIVVKAGPAMEKVCSGELDDRIAASPAVAGNTIYVRTGKSLYAFAEAR
ncbi:MAG: PQQ-binding-like beta-propeller repeat protein [Thermoguttaceae bacterium]